MLLLSRPGQRDFGLPSTLWTAAAIAGALTAEAAAEQPATRTAVAPGWLRAAVAAALIAGSVPAIRMAGGQWWFEQARVAAAAGDGSGALLLAARAESWAPWEARYPMFRAETLLVQADGHASGAGGEALQAAQRAVRLNRHWPAARRLRALAFLAAGDSGSAARDLWDAAQQYPLAARYRRDLEALAERVSEEGDG